MHLFNIFKLMILGSVTLIATLASSSATLAAAWDDLSSSDSPSLYPSLSWDDPLCFFDLCERKILGANGLVPVTEALGEGIYHSSQGVARVELSLDKSGYCTASRVGEALFLTNFHCARQCGDMQFTLGYEADKPAETRQTFKCDALITKNPALDYALFRASISPASGPAEHSAAATEAGPEAGFPILSLWHGILTEGQKVFLPSHPTGRMLEVDASDECVLGSVVVFHTDSGRNTIKHACDSENGSSGGPLIDYTTGSIVGIHWGGVENEYNMAIPMPLIIDDLKSRVSSSVMMELSISDQ